MHKEIINQKSLKKIPGSDRSGTDQSNRIQLDPHYWMDPSVGWVLSVKLLLDRTLDRVRSRDRDRPPTTIFTRNTIDT